MATSPREVVYEFIKRIHQTVVTLNSYPEHQARLRLSEVYGNILNVLSRTYVLVGSAATAAHAANATELVVQAARLICTAISAMLGTIDLPVEPTQDVPYLRVDSVLKAVETSKLSGDVKSSGMGRTPKLQGGFYDGLPIEDYIGAVSSYVFLVVGRGHGVTSIKELANLASKTKEKKLDAVREWGSKYLAKNEGNATPDTVVPSTIHKPGVKIVPQPAPRPKKTVLVMIRVYNDKKVAQHPLMT